MRSLFLLLLLAAAPAAAQPAPEPEPETAVLATIQRLFDGMRMGDSTVVRSVFHPEARLLSVGVREGAVRLSGGEVDAFVRAVGTPHDAVWDERIRDPEIRVDGALATAWVPYVFYLGDRLSHCGVNAFQLFRGPDGWRIIQITDTRRREECEG